MTTLVRPPTGVVLRYKLFGMRVPEVYREWVYKDIMSPTCPREEALRRTWPLVVVLIVTRLLDGAEWSDVGWIFTVAFGPAFIALWQLSARSDRARKEALDRQTGKIAPQFTKATFYWMFGGLVLAGLIYALFELL